MRVNAAPDPRNQAAIALAAMGSYAVGGRSVQVAGADIRAVSLSPALSLNHDPNGTFWIEQAYVHYFIPANLRAPLPILLIHGGGMTGRTWETTPDGRPGWLQRFLEAGLATHVVDIAERGRAGFCALPGFQDEHPITRSLEEAWDLYRLGDPADFVARRPYDGSRFPVHALDAFAAYTVPRWPAAAAVQIAGLRHILERIGPCVVVGHSQGGGFAVRLGAERPDLAPHVIALEPHGDLPSRAGGAASPGRLAIIMGDYLDRTAVWRDLHANTLRVADGWNAAGGVAEVMYLGSHGLPGHSHMMMMDEGSDDVARIVIRDILEHAGHSAPMTQPDHGANRLHEKSADAAALPTMTVSRQGVS